MIQGVNKGQEPRTRPGLVFAMVVTVLAMMGAPEGRHLRGPRRISFSC